MTANYLEIVEQLHVFIRGGKVLFKGTPDRVLTFPAQKTTVVMDLKSGRNEVQPAEGNLQLRSYLTMIPAFDIPEEAMAAGLVDDGFRPSALLRLQLCPGSLALERQMASQGLSAADSSEDAAEGQMLHKASLDPLAPRDHLNPEQLDMVQKGEQMMREFLELILSSNPIYPFYGAIIQPRTQDKAEPVFYTESDIVLAKEEINVIWDEAHREGAQRNPSQDACRHCPAKQICPEFAGWLGALDKIQRMPSAQWSEETWDIFLSRRGELERWLKDRYEEAKMIKAAVPTALPGWTLRDGNEVRFVTDVIGAWSKLAARMSAEQFTQCCSIKLTDLENMVWEAAKANGTPITQPKAKEVVNKLLAGVIDKRTNKPSLVKAKE